MRGADFGVAVVTFFVALLLINAGITHFMDVRGADEALARMGSIPLALLISILVVGG